MDHPSRSNREHFFTLAWLVNYVNLIDVRNHFVYIQLT